MIINNVEIDNFHSNQRDKNQNFHPENLKAKENQGTYEGVVESSDEYELAVGGELGEGNSRDFIVN